MKETEKVEIMHFDQEGYLADGKAAVEAGDKMEALADRVADEGYDAIFLMGVGGTWDEFMQLEYLMNKYGDKDLEVYLIHAAEWNVAGHKRMTSKSVVLTASESGTTPEVLEAIGKLKEMGVRVFAMTKPEGPIGQAVGADNCIKMASSHGEGGCEMGYYLADRFGLKILERRGCFPKYREFVDQTKDVDAIKAMGLDDTCISLAGYRNVLPLFHLENNTDASTKSVSEFMVENPTKVFKKAKLSDVAKIMDENDFGQVPVHGDNEELIGMIYDIDVLLALLGESNE
jgi:fructoselysine-6-phosphate deglycase